MRAAAGAPPDGFKAALNAESSDPDVLTTWLQGLQRHRRAQPKPFRLRGDVTVAPGGFAIDAMKAEIDGGALEGRVAVSHRGASGGSRVDAELKAERLDLDAATAFVRSHGRAASRMAGPGIAVARHRPRHRRPGRSCARSVHKIGYDPKSVIAGTVEDRPAGQC